MSDSVRSHRRQPTRLPHPWDSPGKNTGVGCHFLLQCMKVKSESEVANSCPTLSDPMDCSLPGSSVQGIFQARVLEWGAIAFSTVTQQWITNTPSITKSYQFYPLTPMPTHQVCVTKSQPPFWLPLQAFPELIFLCLVPAHFLMWVLWLGIFFCPCCFWEI